MEKDELETRTQTYDHAHLIATEKYIFFPVATS